MLRALRRDALRLAFAALVVSAVLVGNHGAALAASGMTWSAADDIAGTNELEGVSCPSSLFCVAVDSDGNAYTYNGSTWSAADDIAGTNVLNAVSCPSSSFCVTVDSDGNAYTYNGSTWSAADDIAELSTSLYGVSCPSSSFCAAVAINGDAYTYDGSTWSEADDIAGTNIPSGVSCPSSSFCVAVDYGGNAYIGTGYEPDSIDITADVEPGTLAFATAPAGFTFTPITLDGSTQTSAATEALDIGDNTGSGGGWNVTLSNTTFTDAASNTLDDSDFTIPSDPEQPLCDTPGECTNAVWSDNVSYPYGLPGSTAIELLSAAADSGMGDQTVTIDWTATIPPTAYSGAYTSTWTLTLVSGP